VTKARTQAAEAPEAVREILRRAGHELRNALNGVAVNVEVVRSRADREGSPKELASFAERASAQVGEASALTDGLLALVGSVLAAQAGGTLKTTGDGGAGTRIELMIYGDRSASIVSDIERLTSRIGVGVETDGPRVILRVLPQGKSHSKD
jgi:signal transduction histidine kinase